jgi:hypothetical protein
MRFPKKSLFLLALAVCPLAFGASPYEAGTKENWLQSRFPVLSYEALPPGPSEKPTTYTFPLSLVFVKNSQWTREAILAHLEKTKKIFQQCDLSPSPVALITVDPPLGYSDALGSHKAEIAAILPPQIRPVLFFMNVNGTSESYADDFTPDSPMRALTYTAWMSEDVNSPSYLQQRDASYDPMAHELAHMIGNSGHVPGRNLLAGDPAEVNGDLVKAQCAEMQKSVLVKKSN